MCGIAGLISRTTVPPDRERLDAMTASVAHRGPDGVGTFIDGRVGLGHRRLAIIDLSSGGAQPMHCAASGRVVVYNGEIYNYRELRVELASGYRFRTDSDTEVILAAYDRWGAACVERFNGMWAFALYDRKADVVFCARDRFGVKPFYYLDDVHCFAFGSELRQLLPLLGARRASRDVLLAYLAFAIDERGADTFFAGVRRLLPGHTLSFDVSAGTYAVRRYYRLERQSPRPRPTAAEAGEQLRALLTDAVRLRLRSDVPVGTCLSGGLDSSSVAALAAMVTPPNGPRFAAITAGSESAANDESAYAEMVAERAGLDWHRIQPDFAQFHASIGDVVRAQEEPFTTPSVCLQYFVMQEARRRGLPVLLDGQGGDETLLGYERYAATALRELWTDAGPAAAWRTMRALAKHNAKLPLRRQAQLLGYFSSSWLRWRRLRGRLHDAPWCPTYEQFRVYFGEPARTVFDMQRREIETDSIPHLLRYEDKNAMWHSVETRLPFLDYRLVEFALNLPLNATIGGGWTKGTLREAMRETLPPAVTWRRRKQGFDAPDDLWLPLLASEMRAAVAASPLLHEVCGASVASSTRRLPQAVVWRMYVVARWEATFGVTGAAA